MSLRDAFIKDLCELIICNKRPNKVTKVAIDGVDGAGKTTLANELSIALETEGEQVIRASIDGFHNSQDLRYAKGRHSPEGFYLDSYNYDAFKNEILRPLSDGGSRKYRTAIYDVTREQHLIQPHLEAPQQSIFICDGIFLHRPELIDYWDLSIFLDVGFDISIPRGAQRGTGSPDPNHIKNQRYIGGQRLYLDLCQPKIQANIVIDYNDLVTPKIVRIDPVLKPS